MIAKQLDRWISCLRGGRIGPSSRKSWIKRKSRNSGCEKNSRMGGHCTLGDAGISVGMFWIRIGLCAGQRPSGVSVLIRSTSFGVPRRKWCVCWVGDGRWCPRRVCVSARHGFPTVTSKMSVPEWAVDIFRSCPMAWCRRHLIGPPTYAARWPAPTSSRTSWARSAVSAAT